MKKNSDAKNADELLKKLQASFLGSAKEKKSKEDAPTKEDLDFQQKLAALLNQATADVPQKGKKSRSKATSTGETLPIDDAPALCPEEETQAPSPEPVAPPVKTERRKKPRKTQLPKAPDTPLPSGFDEPIDEPAHVAVEEPVDETTPVAVEEPVDEPTPVAVEEPVDETTPVAVEEKFDEPAPVAVEEPVDETTPVAEEEPVDEPTPVAVEEPVDETTPVAVEEPVDEPSPVAVETPVEESAPPPKTILQPKKTKSYAPPKAEPASEGSASVRIIPRQMPPTTPEKEDKSTIVIKPTKNEHRQAAPIVIAPRNTDEPVNVTKQPETSSEQPIRIGRPTAISQPRQSADAPNFYKTKNDALPDSPPPTAAPAAQQPAQKRPSLPKMPPKPTAPDASVKEAKQETPPAPSKRKVPSTSPASKRRIRSIHHTPVTELPEEETYDEALDEVVNEEAEIRLEEIPYEEPEVTQAPTSAPLTGTKKNRSNAKQKSSSKQGSEKTLPIYDLIKKKTGLDEEDIAMIFELGYDNELGRIVGYENLKKLKAEHLRRMSQRDHKHYRTSFGYRGKEFTGENRDSLIVAYAKDRGALIRRILFSAILTFVLLLLEYPQWVGGRLMELNDLSPYLFPLLSLLAFVGVALLSLRQLNAGLRTFFKFAATPYSVLSLMTPVILCYDILQILFPYSGMIKANFIAALAFLLVAIADVCRLVGEMKSFVILSTDTEKTVLAPSSPRKKKLRYGDRIVKIVNEDAGSALYRVQKAKDTTGFFRRCNAMDSAVLPFSILIPLSGTLALLAGLSYSIFCETAVFPSLSVAMTVLLVSLPASTVFAFFYPLCRANTLLAKRNCTLVGEESVSELSQPKTVIFDDADMYTAEKCNEIAVRQSDNFKEDLALAGALFRKIGATLSGIGMTSPKMAEKDPPITVVRIAEQGIEAVINNQHHVLAGSAEFLKKSGVRVPKETSDKALRRIGNVSLMYVAINSVLKLSYELQYRTYRSFEEMARLLAEHETSVAIHSYDPDLNDRFLRVSRIDTAEPVRVIKPGRYEQDSVIDVTDTAAVALGKKTDIAYPIYAAGTVRQVQRNGMLLHLMASLGCGIATAAIALLGYHDAIGILSIAGYHLSLFMLSWLHVSLRLNPRSIHLKQNKK